MNVLTQWSRWLFRVMLLAFPLAVSGCFPMVISDFPSARSGPLGNVSLVTSLSGSRFVTAGYGLVASEPDGYPAITQGNWVYDGAVLAETGRLSFLTPGLSLGVQLTLGCTAQLDGEYQLLGVGQPKALALAIDAQEQVGFGTNTMSGAVILQKAFGPIDWALGARYGSYQQPVKDSEPPLYSMDNFSETGSTQYMGEPSGDFADFLVGAYFPISDHLEGRLQVVERSIVDPIRTYATVDGQNGSAPQGYSFNYQPIWNAFSTLAWCSASAGPGQELIVTCDEACVLWVDGRRRAKLRAGAAQRVAWVKKGVHHLVLGRTIIHPRDTRVDGPSPADGPAEESKIEQDVLAADAGDLSVSLNFRPPPSAATDGGSR